MNKNIKKGVFEKTMVYQNWNEMLYTDEEFDILYEASKHFHDDINSNHPVRNENESFAEFINKGSDALLRDSADFVASLI